MIELFLNKLPFAILLREHISFFLSTPAEDDWICHAADGSWVPPHQLSWVHGPLRPLDFSGHLGGGFKYFLFSLLPGEMIQFD